MSKKIAITKFSTHKKVSEHYAHTVFFLKIFILYFKILKMDIFKNVQNRFFFS